MLWICEIQDTQCMIFMQELKGSYTVKPNQAYPQRISINEFIIRKFNALVVADFKLFSTFLHA